MARCCLTMQFPVVFAVSHGHRFSAINCTSYRRGEGGGRFVACSQHVNTSTYTLRPLPLLVNCPPLHPANLLVYLPRAGHEQHRRHQGEGRHISTRQHRRVCVSLWREAPRRLSQCPRRLRGFNGGVLYIHHHRTNDPERSTGG